MDDDDCIQVRIKASADPDAVPKRWQAPYRSEPANW